MEFGEFLRKKRKAKKMSIRQLALYAGCSDSYLSQLERGERGHRGPTPSFLRKLAAPLGVPYEVIMAAAGYHLLSKDDDIYTGALVSWLRESLGEEAGQFADRIGIDVEEINSLELHGVSTETLQRIFEKIFEPQRLLTHDQKMLLREMEDVFHHVAPEMFPKVELLLHAVFDIVRNLDQTRN